MCVTKLDQGYTMKGSMDKTTVIYITLWLWPYESEVVAYKMYNYYISFLGMERSTVATR
jgi:hypothetical protein